MNVAHKQSRCLTAADRGCLTLGDFRSWMELFAEEVDRSEAELTELDLAIGDGDHGTNMRRGMRAAVAELSDWTRTDVAGALRLVSASLTSSVGGASGPLYGAFFLHGSHRVLHKEQLGLADLTALIEAGCEGVVKLGRAEVGDKTMVDVLAAAVGSLRTSCRRRDLLPHAAFTCASVARQAALGTIPMVARKGRASYLGKRSRGHQDPGAASAHMLLETLAQSLSHLCSPTSNPAFQPAAL